MIVAALKETFPGERRVGLIPAAVKPLAKLGADLVVERGAGAAAGFEDSEYEEAGARLADDRSAIIREAQVLVQVRAAAANPEHGRADLEQLQAGQVLIAQCDPLSDPQGMVEVAGTGAVVFALELVPRITRAQSADVLSSMATIAGYKAVLLAAAELPQMFPMLMTAAGTLKPARVLIVGAGVAGLQAIATAKRLGALVSAYDVRAAVKEQVESLGAKFVEMDLGTAEGEGGYAKQMDEDFYRRQRELMLSIVAESDVVVTTAAVPGKKAPILVTEEMVEAMPAGSVIVDLAAERGGNCALTKAGETVTAHSVTILCPVNLPSSIPRHASQMYSNNVLTLLKLLIKDGKVMLDLSDEVLSGTLLARSGDVVHPLVREAAGLGPLEPEAAAETQAETEAAASEEPPPDTYRLSSGD